MASSQGRRRKKGLKLQQHDDQQLVDYLFDELSDEEAIDFEHSLEEDTDLAGEVSSFGETLDVMRELEAEDPPEWLSSKVMAEARQVAEAASEGGFLARLRKLMWGPAGGLVGAAVAAMGVALALAPQLMLEQAPQSPDQVAFEMAGREMESAPTSVEMPVMDGAADKPGPVPIEAKAAMGAKADQAAAGDLADEEVATDLPPPEVATVTAAPAPRNEGPSTKGRRSRRRAAPRQQPASTAKPTAKPTAQPMPALKAAESTGRSASGAGKPRVEKPKAPASGSVADEKRSKDSDFGLSEGTLGDSFGPSDDVAKLGKKKESAKASPQQLAKDMIRAAETELQRGQVDSARRVLARAVQRLAQHPARGWVLLRRAQLELNQAEYRAARRYALAASQVADFKGQADARSLLVQISRAEAPPAAAAPPGR